MQLRLLGSVTVCFSTVSICGLADWVFNDPRGLSPAGLGVKAVHGWQHCPEDALSRFAVEPCDQGSVLHLSEMQNIMRLTGSETSVCLSVTDLHD